MRSTTPIAALVLMCFALGCPRSEGPGDGAGSDAGRVDLAPDRADLAPDRADAEETPEVGGLDAGALDAAFADAAELGDASAPDAEVEVDAAPVDLGLADAGLLDADPAADAALPDTGPPDVGPRDSGPPDAGFFVECNVCHGDLTSAAPPRAVSGETDRAVRGVGAHRPHLDRATWRREIRCAECHVVPTELFSPGHLDDPLPAEVRFAGTATAAGVQPRYDGRSCSAVYCHGASLLPQSSAVDWTSLTPIRCGGCHGVPPPPPHPALFGCGDCHPSFERGTATVRDPERHIDGVLDISLGCNGCHGSPSNAAPPTDLLGRSDTALRTVGAHQSHLAPSGWRRAMDCASCHVVPARISDPGHIDGVPPADLSFGVIARAGGASPLFDGATCAEVYCHGATLDAGGRLTTPAWTRVDGTQARCGTCHGLPPPAPHPQSGACEVCHPAVAGPGLRIHAPDLHVDGVLQVVTNHPRGWSSGAVHGAAVNAGGLGPCEACHGAALDGGPSTVSCESCHPGWQTNCTFCHGGTLDASGAPPASLSGATARTLRAVGAHTEHLGATNIHVAWTCDKCHVMPTSARSPGHIDGVPGAEVVFGPPNAGATYDPATGTCANLYCHGNGGAVRGSAVWETDLTMDCTSCHPWPGVPRARFSTMSYGHPFHFQYPCNTCHAETWNYDPVRIAWGWVDQNRHIDGRATVRLNFAGYENAWNGTTCTPPCHATYPWR